MAPAVYFADNKRCAGGPDCLLPDTGGDVNPPGDSVSMWRRCWERIRGDEGQNVSEYAVLLVLLVLIVVAAVHALGMNAQQVINRVNTALMGG